MDEKKRLDLSSRNMVGHYKLGNEQIALLLAATLFETYINGLYKNNTSWDNDRICRTSLEDKINELTPSDLGRSSLFKFQDIFTKYYANGLVRLISRSERERLSQIRKRLHNFRWLRNKIVHNQIDQLTNEYSGVQEDLIVFLWSELSPISFEKAYSKRQKGENIFSVLYEHSADYMVRSLSEVDFLTKDKAKGYDFNNIKIIASDFENLFVLREKMVSLKNYLNDWLLEKNILLQTDVLTTIDTTSGYIWMPLVPTKSVSNGRASVYECSVSFLATPGDLRIYMDFGGYQRNLRKLYYKFLSDSPEYLEFSNRFVNKQFLKVFDIDWYFLKFNERPFSEWLLSKESAIAMAKNKIEKCKKSEASPITWNRCLHGYVYSKFDLGDICLDFSMIEEELLMIIYFYNAFLNFRLRNS